MHSIALIHFPRNESSFAAHFFRQSRLNVHVLEALGVQNIIAVLLSSIYGLLRFGAAARFNINVHWLLFRDRDLIRFHLAISSVE